MEDVTLAKIEKNMAKIGAINKGVDSHKLVDTNEQVQLDVVNSRGTLINKCSYNGRARVASICSLQSSHRLTLVFYIC